MGGADTGPRAKTGRWARSPRPGGQGMRMRPTLHRRKVPGHQTGPGVCTAGRAVCARTRQRGSARAHAARPRPNSQHRRQPAGAGAPLCVAHAAAAAVRGNEAPGACASPPRARQCSRECVRPRGLGALRRLAHCVPCRQDTDYKWQHMPNQMMMALVQDYPYGEMQTSRGGGTHGPPYSLPHEQVRT